MKKLVVALTVLLTSHAWAGSNKQLAGRCEQLAKTIVHINVAQRNKHCIKIIHTASEDAYAAKLWLEAGNGHEAITWLNATIARLDEGLNRKCRKIGEIANARAEALTIAQLVI